MVFPRGSGEYICVVFGRQLMKSLDLPLERIHQRKDTRDFVAAALILGSLDVSDPPTLSYQS